MPSPSTDPGGGSAAPSPPSLPEGTPPTPPAAARQSGSRRGVWMALAAVAVLGTLVVVGLSGDDAEDAAPDCMPADPVTATVETFRVTPAYPAVPGADPLEIPQDVEVNGTITNTSGVAISAAVQIPMIGYPDQVVYSDYIDLDPGATVEYTATSMLLQQGPAVPLNPDESSIVVDWTQTGAHVPGCDP